MEAEHYRALLRRHDDPVHLENPGGWTFETNAAHRAAEQRFTKFAEALRRAFGQACRFESGAAVQDSSFLGRVILPRECFVNDELAPIRVSNFDNMATIYGGDDAIDRGCFRTILSLMESHGYIYIPPMYLWEAYEGAAPEFVGIRNWGIRYFDWL